MVDVSDGLFWFWLTSRTQFGPMLGNCGASLVDPRGKLVARSYDILGGVSFPPYIRFILKSQYARCLIWFMQACIPLLYSKNLTQMQYHLL
jgi:hypothetical protein